MELSLKGPANWLVNKSDFPQSGLVLRESCNCPSSTCYFPVVLTPAPPSGDLGLALPALRSPPVAVISLVVDKGRGLPETKHWPGTEPASQPRPHLPLGKLTVHGKSSLTSKELLILEELCVPDFDLPQIRSLHTPKRPFYISEARSWLSLLLTCGAALPSTLTVAHPPSKMGPWAACPGQKP